TIVAKPGVTTVGTSGPDVIVGTNGPDDIRGRGGRDIICAKKGADLIRGGPGADLVLGNGGADKIWGGGGHDVIDGGPGRDTIRGGGGGDIIAGGRHSDTLFGNAGADEMGGGGGSDTVKGGSGDDILYGDSGNDALRGDLGDDELNGGVGFDDCVGGPASDTSHTDKLSFCEFLDEFAGSLEPGWTWASGDPALRSLGTPRGLLSIQASATPDLDQELLRPPLARRFEIEVSLLFQPVRNFDHAGLIVRGNDTNSITLTRGYCAAGGTCSGGDAIYLENTVDGTVDIAATAVIPPGTAAVWLSLTHERSSSGPGTYRAWLSFNATTWEEIGSITRAMKDPQVGIVAGGAEADPAPVARFGYFLEQALD
ncbi:MAG: hypothetical protein ACR2PK_17375, partial [Acidimicrobiales bacterium]